MRGSARLRLRPTPRCPCRRTARRRGGSRTCAASIRTCSRAHPGTLELDGEAGGAVFTTLARAVETHPEVVERYLGTVVSAGEKFAAANAAHWHDGVLVHVPAGVSVEAPLRSVVELTEEGSALQHRVLVVLERGATATFVEEFRSGVPGYLNVVVELIVADEAHLEYVTIQHHHAETRQFGTHRATVGRDAELDWVAAALGGTRAKSRMESLLAGPGARVKVTGAYYLNGTEHIDYDTTQEHAAPNTSSDLAFKGVLDDRARAVWRGVIRVDKGAQKTDAYQENRNLLLSTDAQATPIPGLEIEANDVRCTHGATVGQVDSAQLFYLMARGLEQDRGPADDRPRLLRAGARADRLGPGARAPRRGARVADRLSARITTLNRWR